MGKNTIFLQLNACNMSSVAYNVFIESTNTETNKMNEKDLNEMLDGFASEVAAGTLLKNIRHRLELKTKNTELVDKLVRIVELRANELGA